MLFSRVVYQDVDPGELLDGFRDGLSTELFLADVACNQQAFAAVFFHQAFCFVRILFFFEIDHCNICAFFRESYGDGAAYSAVAAGDDRCLIPQFFTGAIRFILSLRSGPHFMFPARLLMLALARLKFPFVRHRIPVHGKLPHPSQRRRLRVRTAFFAAAERERAERRAEARFACRDNAFFDAARRPSRLSAALVARDRVREVLLRPPLRPLARLRLAWRFVRFLPRSGGGNFTPALRAFDRPMATACCGERAPCSPSRICSISSRTNSPAWVEGDLPSRSSSRALSTGSSSGIPIRFAPQDTFGRYEKRVGLRVYLITPRIEQLTTTENISRDGNDSPKLRATRTWREKASLIGIILIPRLVFFLMCAANPGHSYSWVYY